jgi:rRNA processing protein Gar1
LPEFNNLGNVKTIDCQSNDLSGNIPSLTLCPKLGILFLSNNQFTGLLPNFNYLPLWGFSAWNNNLSGCFPDFICSNPSFSVHTNPLMPFQGDKTNFCNGESQIGAPCDDRNPNTTNDKINVDCTCRGCTSSNVTQSFSICKTETIIVGISTYTLPGTYVDTLQSSTGCDSILTTIITQKPNASFSQNIQICQGKTHTVGSNTYNLPGVYIDTLQSSIGCDSIITTTITQKPNASLSQNIQICQGESISIGSNSYDSNGLYVDTLISRNGCDSIVRTILNVLQIQKTDDVIAICAGQSHQVGNKTYTQSGNYIDTLQSIFGCDSIISTFLTVRPSQNISFNAPDKICKGTEVNLSVNALGTYLWSDGQTSANISEILNANKTYRVSVTDQFGCLASSSISISVVEPKNIAIPIADTLTLCLKDTIIDPYSFLTQFDANGTWTLDENNISGQPFNLMELTERIHTLNYGFFQQAPCPDKDTSFTLVVKDCRIIDCSFILKDDSIKVNKNEASDISLTINDILPEEYIISIISVDPDVLESTSISDEGLYSFTVTGDFGDIVQVVYEICTPDCADCKQASLWIDNEAIKDIIRTNIILPNTSGKNATFTI